MDKIVLWGCGRVGGKAYDKLTSNHNIVAFGDNDPNKQNLIYKGLPVIGFEEMKYKYADCRVVVTMENYYGEAERLSNHNMKTIGYYDVIREKVLPWQKISWDDVKKKKQICLYAGDIYENFDKYPDDYVICLSLTWANYRSIQHDITIPYPLESNCIDCYQIEDVLEHIALEKVIPALNEIYRILKKGGYLRCSLPDYHSPLVLHNSFLDKNGNIIFDPTGGGKFVEGKVCEGGHVWFPTYELVRELLEKSKFNNFKFYRYRNPDGRIYAEDIDYSRGYINRTKEHTAYKEDISIVVDCFK